LYFCTSKASKLRAFCTGKVSKLMYLPCPQKAVMRRIRFPPAPRPLRCEVTASVPNVLLRVSNFTTQPEEKDPSKLLRSFSSASASCRCMRQNAPVATCRRRCTSSVVSALAHVRCRRSEILLRLAGKGQTHIEGWRMFGEVGLLMRGMGTKAAPPTRSINDRMWGNCSLISECDEDDSVYSWASLLPVQMANSEQERDIFQGTLKRGTE
jgi:hypothetical protein